MFFFKGSIRNSLNLIGSLWNLTNTFSLIFIILLELELASPSVYKEAHLSLSIVEEVIIDYTAVLEENSQNDAAQQLASSVSQPGICAQEQDVKITFCAELLANEEYQFVFTFNLNEQLSDLKCHPQKFILSYLDQKNLKVDQIPMYKCPYVAESEFMTLTHTYYVAESHIQFSALLFRQRDMYSRIMAYKFIEGIDFSVLNHLSNQLFSNQDHRLQRISDEQVPKHVFGYRKASKIKQSKGQYEALENLLKVYKLLEPYRKFRNTYRIMNVCSMTTAQKIHMCEEIITDYEARHVNVDASDYIDAKCEKRAIFYDVMRQKAFMQECPPVVRYFKDVAYDAWRQVYLASVYFVSSGLFVAEKGKGRTFLVMMMWSNGIRVDSVIENLDAVRLTQVRQVERLQRYSPRIEPHEIIEQLPKYAAAPTKYQPMLQVLHFRKYAEFVAFQMVNFKQLKLVYRKFISTYTAQNICSLPAESKQKLCEDVFENPDFGFKILVPSNTSFRCIRKPICMHTIRMLTEKLCIGFLSLVRCPVARARLQIYRYLYLSGSMGSYFVTAYTDSYREQRINPVAVVPLLNYKPAASILGLKKRKRDG